MESKSIYDSRLEISNKNKSEMKNIVKSSLAHDLLLYDSITFPTVDFCIIPELINWFGEKYTQKALEEGVFKFMRYFGGISVASQTNNGKYLSMGIGSFLYKGKNTQTIIEQKFKSHNFTKAIELQMIRHPRTKGSISKKMRGKFTKLVKENTLHIDATSYSSDIESECFNNLFLDEDFAKHFEQNKSDSKVFKQYIMKQLSELAQFNWEMNSLSKLENHDIQLHKIPFDNLKQKVENRKYNKNLEQAFLQINSYRGIPDIGSAITNGLCSLEEIWDIRNKKESKHFREWLSKNTPETPDEFISLYNESIQNKSLVESLPLKIIRWAILEKAKEALPFAGTIAGTIGGTLVAPTFGLEAVFGGIIGNLAGKGIADFTTNFESKIVSRLLSKDNPKIFFDVLKSSLGN